MSVTAVLGSRSENPFDRLPDEIMVDIFKYVGNPYQLGAVSKRWHAIAWDCGVVQTTLDEIIQKIGQRSYRQYLTEIKREISEPAPQQILQELVSRICKKAKFNPNGEGHGAIRCMYNILYPLKKIADEDIAATEETVRLINDFSDVMKEIEDFNMGKFPNDFFPKKPKEFFCVLL